MDPMGIICRYIYIYVQLSMQICKMFLCKCHSSPRIFVRLCRSGSLDELNIDSICAGKLDHTWNHPVTVTTRVIPFLVSREFL